MSYTVIVHRRDAAAQYDQLGLAPFVIPLITAAPGIFQSILGLFGVGKQTAQFQGLAGINSGGAKVIQGLQQIMAMLQAPQLQVDPAQALAEAQRIVGQLEDPAIFYPAKKGKDAAALTKFKADAAALMGQIQPLAASRMQQLQQQQQSSTGIFGGGGGIGGMSPSTLLLLGVLGLGGVYLFTRQQ